MTKYKIALFDLDGTLTDPQKGITNCVQYALDSYGIYNQPMDILLKFIGPPLTESFMVYYGFDEEKAIEAVAKYRERFTDTGIFENKLFEGTDKMLQTLKEAGVVLCVASSKPEVFVKRILKHFEIEQYFDIVKGSLLSGERVNKHEVIQAVLDELQDIVPGYKLADMIMVGDRLHDINGAKTIGIDSLGVAFGYGGREELENYGATYIADTMEEVTSYIL